MMRIANSWVTALFDGEFYLSTPVDVRRPACSLVFVQSADGNTGADNPEALGGGATDKHLIYEGLSRVAADAVLAGAETVRGADLIFSIWHPEVLALRASLGLARHPMQIIATRRGLDVDDVLLLNVPEIPVTIITTPDGADVMRDALATRPWIRVLRRAGAENLASAFEQLRAAGVMRVSCVGGRQLARQLLDAGLVDDLYLTTAPRPGGEPHTPLYPRPLRGHTVVRKRGTGPEAGVTFEHLARPTPVPAAPER
jgi:riboflavin biosynthesis pyrimidine reductase